MKLQTYLTIFFCVTIGGSWSHAEEKYKSKDEIAIDFKNLNNLDFSTLPHVNSRHDGVFIWNYPGQQMKLPRLGLVQTPDAKIRVIHRNQNQIIFDRIYTTDKYSRRANLSPPQSYHKKMLVLAGDSFTFGDGLDDADSLHNVFNLMKSSYYAYNYAQSGGSLNTFLARLFFAKDFKVELSFEEGDLLYIYTNDHVARVVGTWPNEWTFFSPYFKKNQKNEMEYAGSILDNMSLFRKLIVTNADALPNFLKKDRFIPRLTAKDYEYFCDLVQATRDAWAKRVKAGRFTFMFHPLSQVDQGVVKCLEHRKIPFVRLAVSGDTNLFTIPLDGHPTAYFNKLFAAQLIDYYQNKLDI